jgi:hypothetical protein
MMPLAMSASSIAADAAHHSVVSSESKLRQPAGSAALPDAHITGDKTCVVASRSTTIFCATAGVMMLGSSTDTDETMVGNASEATMAVIQIQRVPPRPIRAARSAT